MTSAGSLAVGHCTVSAFFDAAYAIEAPLGRGLQREWLPHRIFIPGVLLRPAPISHNASC